MATNLIDAGLSPQSSSAPPTDSQEQEAPATTPTSSAPTGNLLDFGAGLSSSSSSGGSPVSGNLLNQGAGILPTSSSENDTGAPFYKKAWAWANRPLIDVDSALGRTDKAGGVEKGVSDLLSGLSSPLSLALTIGSFGAGGLAESAGASVLRSAGLAASDIGEVTKGAAILADTLKTGRTAADGLAAAEAAGINPATLTKGLQALDDAKLGTDSLLTNGLIRRGGGAILRQFGVGTAKADTFAQGIQSLVNGGFTVQNAYSAVENSPRVLDALKDGDYEEAKRLAIDALGTGTLAAFGAGEFARESGSLRDTISEKMGLKIKPTEENLALRNLAGENQAAKTEAGYANSNWVADLRQKYKDLDTTDLQRTANYIEAGKDTNTMAERYNALAEAAGRPERMPVVESPDNGLETAETPGMNTDRIRELIDRKKLAEKPESYVTKLLESYDPTKVSDKISELAQVISDKHNETLEDPRNKDVIPQGVANYITHLWKDSDKDNDISNTARHDIESGSFPTSTTMARARMFSSAFEGQLLGKELKVTDPISLAANNANTFSKIAANHKFLDDVQDTGIKGSDGRPLAVMGGSARELGDEENKAVMVNPGVTRSSAIPQAQVEALRASGDLDKAINSGAIEDRTRKVIPDNIQDNIYAQEKRLDSLKGSAADEARADIQTMKDVRDGKLTPSALSEINDKMPPSYKWTGNGYKSMDMQSLKDWRHVATTSSGDNVFLKSDLKIHPEAADYMERILGIDPKGVGEGAISKTAQKINSELKGINLSFSIFHTVQEALRGITNGINPVGIERIDLAKDPVLRNGVRNGLTLGKDRQGLSAFQDGAAVGHSALIDKIPVFRTVQHGLDSFLFDKFIPSLKVKNYRSLVDKYTAAYPNWTQEKISRTAAEHTNALYGGLNYTQMGRAAATQNWFKLGALAPDFAESEVRSISRLFGSEGKVARVNMLKATAGIWAAARIANMLVSGKMRNDVPFGVAIKDDKTGKDKVYSMRTLPTDALHLIHDPENFLRGRLSPIAKVGTELALGRDQQGRRLDNAGMAVDLASQMTPIVAQSAVKKITGAYQPEMSTSDQIAKAAGLTVAPLRSEALKLAQQISSDHSANGPVDTESLQKHQKLQDVENQLYAGKITVPDISQAVFSGELSQSDARRMVKNYEMVREMPPDMANLYLRASHLPTKDLLDVYDASTNGEKRTLAPLVQKSSATYMKNSVTKLTPAERITDPTIKRIQALMPTATPF